MTNLHWQDVTALPTLPSSTECHIWLWSLDLTKKLEMGLNMLSPDEISVAHRFVFEEDKARYILSHRMMRFLLSTYIQCAPSELQIVSSILGKPMLANRFSGLHFSLSHTFSHAILAVARSPVGADIECVRPIERLVAEMHFSKNELSRLAAYEGNDWIQCFFRCWTRKEAVLKGEGIGLNIPLASFDVEIAHDKAAALLCHRLDSQFTREWKLYDISPTQTLTAAVAVSAEVHDLKLLSIELELMQ